MKLRKSLICLMVLGLAVAGFLAVACAPPKPEPVKTGSIADGEYDPAKWGQIYPLEYDTWLKTKDPKPTGKSKYKKGYDADLVTYDKLSEFPYMALLFNGWGFGVEYNEPRGHFYMITDQLEVDPSRLKAGGACLTCKTPFAPKLMQEMGEHYFSDPYLEVHAKIPQQFQRTGVMCIDCHDNKTLNPQLSRWTLKKALTEIGKDPNALSRQEARSAVCAQCHVTYIVKKDTEGKSTAVFFPWGGSKPGDISIENIIKVIKSDSLHGEWVQNVTGFKVGFIRHPEYEFFTKESVHSKAGVACADCHMPYTRVGANKISDHDVAPPTKKDLKACQQCHSQGPDWLRDQLYAIQDRTVSGMNRSGYATAVAAKLFEMVNKAKKDGKQVDQAQYDKAKDLYLEAFYRVVFIGAENSVGFHNPSEAGRIMTDATAFAMKCEGMLRQMLTKAGVEVPVDMNLEIAKYINERGIKKLKFKPEFEFKDPFGLQDRLTPNYGLVSAK